jgi:hypothetical protein
MTQTIEIHAYYPKGGVNAKKYLCNYHYNRLPVYGISCLQRELPADI